MNKQQFYEITLVNHQNMFVYHKNKSQLGILSLPLPPKKQIYLGKREDCNPVQAAMMSHLEEERKNQQSLRLRNFSKKIRKYDTVKYQSQD